MALRQFFSTSKSWPQFPSNPEFQSCQQYMVTVAAASEKKPWSKGIHEWIILSNLQSWKMNPYPSSVIITFFITELSPVPKRCCVSFQTQTKVVIYSENIQHTYRKTDVGWGKKHRNKVIRTSTDSWHNSCRFVVKKKTT